MYTFISKLISSAFICILMSCNLFAAEAELPTIKGSPTLTGQWKTIDDETHEPKSIIEIYEDDQKIYGKIIKLFRKPTEDQNPVCDKCQDELKNKPITGMIILKNLKNKSSTEWSDGSILDPKNGKTYSCKVELIDNGTRLKVRGFIGFSLLGRTQVWEKQ